MDERQEMTNYMMVGHHERLWTSKVQILLFFSTFGCFCLVLGYMLLMVCIHGSDAIDLGLMMQWVPCWFCNGLLMEMHITLHGDGWWKVLHL
jgi:hypothetical protein